MDQYKVIKETWYFQIFIFMVSLVCEMNIDEIRNYEPSHFCTNFTCLGKPWCKWQFHHFLKKLIKPMKILADDYISCQLSR